MKYAVALLLLTSACGGSDGRYTMVRANDTWAWVLDTRTGHVTGYMLSDEGDSLLVRINTYHSGTKDSQQTRQEAADLRSDFVDDSIMRARRPH